MSPEDMKKEENRTSTAFLKFKTIYHHKSHFLFCFFEGDEDIKYYYLRIKENLPNIEWEGVSCGKKQVVLNIYQYLKKHENESYQRAKKAFFVDKDFDDPLPEDSRQEIYETPCYSIENFYTTLDCFKNIVKYEFKISEFGEEDQLFRHCVDLFGDTQRAFHEAMIEFNAWIMVSRRNRVDLNLNNYDKIDSLVKIEVNSIFKLYTIEDLPKGELHEEEIGQISFSDHHCQFRGKQELKFFVKFLTKLKDYLFATKSKKISFQIPESNPLSALTQYAYTPECLRNYLKRYNM